MIFKILAQQLRIPFLYLIKISRGKYRLVHVRFQTARTGIKPNSRGITSFEQICTYVHEKLNGFLKDFLRTPSSILF